MCGDCEICEPKPVAGTLQAKFLDVADSIEAGIYFRRGKVAASEIIIGAVHKKQNLFVLTKGKLALWDSLSRKARIVEAPYEELSLPGMRRVGFTITEIEGFNRMPTTAETPADAEKEMVEPFVLQAALSEVGKESIAAIAYVAGIFPVPDYRKIL